MLFLTLYGNKWLTNGIYQRNGSHTRYTYGLERYPPGTLAKSLEIWKGILDLVPHPSKKDRFPFWLGHVYPIYNPELKNIKKNFLSLHSRVVATIKNIYKFQH